MIAVIALSVSAVQNHACPRCNAQPGEPCRTPSGRKLLGSNTHGARTAATTDSERAAARVERAPSVDQILAAHAKPAHRYRVTVEIQSAEPRLPAEVGEEVARALDHGLLSVEYESFSVKRVEPAVDHNHNR